MQHLEEGTIHAWLEGALDASEGANIERHIAECATCSATVAEARGMIAGASRIVSSLDAVRGNVIPAGSGRPVLRGGWLWRSLRLSPGRAALAATLLLAVGTMLTVQHAPKAGTSAEDARAVAKPVASAAPPIASASPPEPAAAPPKAASKLSTTVSAEAPAAQAVPAVTVAATPPAPVAGAAPAAVAEKTVAQRAAPLDSLKADSVAKASMNSVMNRMAAAPAQGARQFTQGRVQPTALADAPRREDGSCFQMIPDSAAASLAGGLLPRRLLLQQTSGPAPQNIVRAVSPEGRADSVIAGTRWERVSPAMTMVYLNQAASTLTLRFADGVVAGQLSTPAGTRNVDVRRAVCRP